MVVRVNVSPERLRWARSRARLGVDSLTRRFPRYMDWEAGTVQPTLKQLEALAKATCAPIGAFFLSEPLHEPLPLPDYRTLANQSLSQPSVDLLDTVYLCQRRQDWYREFARLERLDPPALVGTATTDGGMEQTAERIAELLAFDVADRAALSTWEDALRLFVARIDAAGVLVNVSGVVGNNTRRRLEPTEFRGFALSDDIAPLIFVNGADAKAAQMFTLAHELAHICLGESALSDADLSAAPSHSVETWCDQVAAELLVPHAALATHHRAGASLSDEAKRLARHFKVSAIVVMRRLLDTGAITRDAFEAAYTNELRRFASVPGSGGNFHPTLRMRVGKRLGRALAESTLAGRTSFTECYRLLGIRKMSTLQDFAARIVEA